jgi:hypothetical protein
MWSVDAADRKLWNSEKEKNIAKSTFHIPKEITFLPILFLRPCIALSVFAVCSFTSKKQK